MNELTFVALVAWAIPLLLSFLKNRRWPSEVTMGLLGVISLAVATLGLVASGEIDADGVHDMNGWLGAAALAFTEASIVYRVVTGGVRGERLNEALTSVLWDGKSQEAHTPSEYGRLSR